MTDKRHVVKLKELLDSLGSHREVAFDGRRWNSGQLAEALKPYHDSDAYTISDGKFIKFDAGDGHMAYIQVAGLAMRG